MQYSPKLKMALEEIKAVLAKHDIAGMVVLHTPPFVEFLTVINPSYSCAKFIPGGIHFRAKAEDFGGSVEIRKEKLQATSNMLHNMAMVGMKNSLALSEWSEVLDKMLWAEHEKGGGTSHDQQNN